MNTGEHAGSASARRRALLRRSPLFNTLAERTLDVLNDDARNVMFERGQTIFNQADQAHAFYIVVEGWVKVYRITPRGDEAVIGVFTSGQNFAEIAALAGEEYPANAAAVTETELIAVPVRRLASIIGSDPQTALIMLSSVSRQVRRLVDEIETLKGLSATQRVVEFLIAESATDDGMCAVNLPYEKALIANRLGMKAESLSRVFQRLRKHGVVVKHDVAIIKDVATLRSLMDPESIGNGRSSAET